MVVYWEYAFAENFLIDGLLLLLSLLCARGKISVWRLLSASGLGAAQAVVFPLLRLPGWASYLVKILFGLTLCLIVAPKGGKALLRTGVAFFALTFAYGGLLTAAYSFFNVEYVEGNGYLVEQAPVALVVCGALAFFVATVLGARSFYAYRKLKRSLCPCTLRSGEKNLSLTGLYDSGNMLTYKGQPVCVVSAAVVFALFGRSAKSAGRITVKTVNGSRDAPVFACEQLQVDGRGYGSAYLTVGEVSSKNYQIILHNSYIGERNETFKPVASLVKKDGGNG